MNDHKWFRRVLMFGAVFNFGAALMLLFPDSIGAFAQLPPAGSVFYSWMLALFIVVLGAAYAWIAFQPTISREVVAIGAIGKTGVFFVALFSWAQNNLSAQALAPAFCDLAFAVVFFWWLLRTRARA